MKYIVLVPDGMADEPIDQLGGKTPLESAKTPNMDYVVQNGLLAQALTIPEDLAPASDVANLSILGYDPGKYYSGRAPLEAAYLGVDLEEEDVAFRCNLVTVFDNKMIDYSAGHIQAREATVLIRDLDEKIGSDKIRFFPGVSYRHLLLLKGFGKESLLKTICVPPHDILGETLDKHWPQGDSRELLMKIMRSSIEILANHEVNKVRVDLSENPANMIWLWGQGVKPQMPTFKEKFGLSGSVISAVDLLKGIGKIIGLKVINVEGATGYYDTNYLGKAKAGIEALDKDDFVFIHVEATDEAGHNGDLRMKIATIERFDNMIVGPILKHFKDREDFRLMILPDHATPVRLRSHTSDKVCVAMMGYGIKPNGFSAFSETEARRSSVSFKGHELMEALLR